MGAGRAAVTLVAVAALLMTLATTGLAGQTAAPQGVPADADLAAQIAGSEAALERTLQQLEGLRKSSGELDEAMRRIERRAEVYALGREFAETLTEQLRRLPRPTLSAAARLERARLLEAVSDANLRVERELGEMDELDAATRLARAEQRDLLIRLSELQFKLLKALREAEQANAELELQGQAAREKLTQLLFWVPAPPGVQMLSELAPSFAWTVSPSNWRAAVAALGENFSRRPLGPGIALLLAAGLLAARRPLQRRLVSLSPTAVGYRHYRIGHALAALAITAGLALPVPIILWTAAHLFAAAPDSQHFTHALSHAFSRSARLLLALLGFAWLLDRRGMAIGHFGWDGAAATFVSDALRRFAAILVPLIFIAALNGLEYAPYANRESLGRLAFGIAMISLAAFLAHVLRRRNPLARQLARRTPRSLAARLHWFWGGLVVALPLVTAGLGVAGYLTAAGYFFARISQSLFIILGAVLLYGLIALWVQVQRYHLRRRREEEAAAEARADEGAGSEAAEVRPPELDIAALGEQTRSLLDLLITLLLLGGLWWVWEDALPVLSVVSDHTLWTYTSTESGKEVSHALTVGSLFLALLVIAVTAVAVRNVGALLDIVLLQRFEVQADATYAIKVMARYILAGVGIVLASRILGIAWSDVHWLVAALGVGLGFGLQEIVANFASGLILLAERPIRIGDVVTVGDVTGTVARIRARATAVVDFDNKEIIIPNKSFITERVVNWTLSNRITRLLLTFGVAYGSDIALVQRVVLEAVRGIPDVLEEPSPSVYFSGFGDSSLDFEIRAFVDSFDKRVRVRHEINFAVERALDREGIEIPFPQRDLHIRSGPGLPEMPTDDPRR